MFTTFRMKLDKVEQIKINSFLHLIIDSNSVSLCRLSLIDDHQSQVDHVFKLTKYDFEQINWTNVFESGSQDFNGSNDSIKWDTACYDYVTDLKSKNDVSFTRLCIKCNTQKPKNEPVLILKDYTTYLGDWYNTHCFSIHWSELPLIDLAALEIVQNDINNSNC